MSGLAEIMNEVRGSCFPGEEEIDRLETVRDLLLERTCRFIADTGFDITITPEVVGSAAKNTHLREADIDLFLLFPTSVDEKRTTEICFTIGKEILDDYITKYASHPYLSGSFMGIGVDVVWAYKVSSGGAMISAVDRTPFHTRYVNEHLQGRQEDEVRFLKQFLKGVGLYSASLRVEGVSGYLTELLILRYGNFPDTVRAIADLKMRTWLHLAGEKEETSKDDGRFRDSALVFIDPVDGNRNVAAALSGDNYYRLIRACKLFLKKPSMDFFIPGSYCTASPEKLMAMLDDRGTDLLSVTFPRPEVVDDILYPQIYKARSSMTKLMEKEGFLVFGCEYTVEAGEEATEKDPSTGEGPCFGESITGRITFLFELDRLELPSARVHAGPPVHMSNADDFFDKWRRADDALSVPYIEEGRFKVIARREHTHAADILRIGLAKLSLGKDLVKKAKKEHILAYGPDVIKENTAEALHRLFTRSESWMRK